GDSRRASMYGSLRHDAADRYRPRLGRGAEISRESRGRRIIPRGVEPPASDRTDRLPTIGFVSNLSAPSLRSSPMEYRRLGSTGLKVSRLCLGCMSYGSSKWRPWVLDEELAKPFIKEALDAGINFFDTADMYSLGASEAVLSRALKEFGVRRSDVVIATKVYNKMGDAPNDRGLSRKHIMDSIDGSLQRLGTDYVDLYQIHRWDHETPIAETLEALNDLVRAGKVRYLGASSMFAWQFSEALHLASRHG